MKKLKEIEKVIEENESGLPLTNNSNSQNIYHLCTCSNCVNNAKKNFKFLDKEAFALSTKISYEY